MTSAGASGGVLRGRRHVIIGAGPLGYHVAELALAAGAEVLVGSRSGRGRIPPGTRRVRCDAADPAQAREACARASVIYNCAQPPYHRWPELFPPIQRALVEAAAATGATLVAAENLYAYGPVPGLLHERLPHAAGTRKGQVRARMAQELMEAAQTGRARTVAGRASDFYGPGVETSFLGRKIFQTIARGRTAWLLGDPDTLHTYTYIGDFARGLVTLGSEPDAVGRAWHVPSAPTMTTRELIALAGTLAGTLARVRSIPSAAVRAAGLLNPLAREAAEMLYEFERPFIVDHSAYAQRFGAQITPHRDAVAQTLEWCAGPLRAGRPPSELA